MHATGSVIIPTTCDALRAACLRRAIASAQAAGRGVEVVVVVNGGRVDPTLRAELASMQGLTVLDRTEGNVSAARYAGLLASTGEYFTFLDDDDELLPGAVAQRIDLFGPKVAVVVTNGYFHNSRVGDEEPLVPSEVAASIGHDPTGTLLRFNWFPAQAATFRRSLTYLPIFDMRLAHYEWTFLYFKLLAHRSVVRFHDVLTYRVYGENAASASKSAAYAAAYPAFLKSLMEFELGPVHRRIVREKYHSALNALAQTERERGFRAGAWSAHLTCLVSGGWRYLSYTRHLLMP